MIKIKFPSPAELSGKDWFEQMELTLFHLKKAYEKFSKGVEKPEDVSIWFDYPEMNKSEKYKALRDTENISYEDTQEIEVVINY